MPAHPTARPVRLARSGGLARTLVLVALALAVSCTSTADRGAAGTTQPTTLGKVTVAGDSISIGLGAALRGVVDSSMEVKVIGEEGTGLARPDRFDWPTRLQALARDFPPTFLVLSLGSNDAQDLTDAKGTVVVPFTDPARWDAEYSRRLAASFDAFAGSSTQVVWVGHVRTKEDRVGLTNRHIHELAKAVAATRPFVRVTDFADLLHTGEDVATRCLVSDGLHLTTACLDEAATALAPTLVAPVGASPHR